MKVEDIFGELPILQTERTILRKIRIDDVDDIFEYSSNSEVSKYTTWYMHQSKSDTQKFVESVIDKYRERKIAPWGIEDAQTKRVVGTAGFVYWDTIHLKAELGYALSADLWNKGYMTEIVKKMVEFGFEQMKLVRIEARCQIDNIGSSRVMEKVGMKYEGILRKSIVAQSRHKDVKLYSILDEEYLQENKF
ncbi:GNAT family N-acetyltransferase [Cohnella sp. LGH]|uniref:GNAT family N-acetyltransferase n=1 Tax=Cohnella sp. LGH TaxID=1619153 RepID=UPI001ADB9FCC|nr:GNAT family protein [Cohnella sp. LGH]QTH41196.1 GNAT family N-acetyltransferase [Cohnella sp. LGH]